MGERYFKSHLLTTSLNPHSLLKKVLKIKYMEDIVLALLCLFNNTKDRLQIHYKNLILKFKKMPKLIGKFL